MDEIKKVIDRLDGELQRLGSDNEADKTSISEKQTAIDTLTAEIDALQKDIEGRKEDMAKLEQKKAEAVEFDKSIEEVVPLIKTEEAPVEVHEEVPEVQEEVSEATFDVPTPAVEDVQVETPADEVQVEEAPAQENNLFPNFAEQAPVEETQTQDIPQFDNNLFSNFTEQTQVEDTGFVNQTEGVEVPQSDNSVPVIEEPADTATQEEEMVSPFNVMDSGEITTNDSFGTQSNMADFNVGDEQMQTFNPAPVFDGNGFDITNANTQVPDISLNEMYNQADQSSIVR